MFEKCLVFFQQQFFLLIGVVFYFFFLFFQKIKNYSSPFYHRLVAISFFMNKHALILGGSFLFIVFILPAWILQKKMAIRLFDDFDHIFIHYVTLARNGNFFILNPFQPITGYMSGIPRLCLPTSFNVIAVLFFLFEPIYAYLLNLTIVKLFAYSGMYFLLTRYFSLSVFPNFIAIGCALCFSILPIYPLTGLSILGLPFLFYAILNLSNNEKQVSSFLIIGLFAFYSSLWYANFFIIIIWFFLIVVNFFAGNKLISVNKNVIISFCLFSGLSLLSDWQLIAGCLSSSFISLRSEIPRAGTSYLEIASAMSTAFFFNNTGDAWSCHRKIIEFLFPLFLLISYFIKKEDSLLNYYWGLVWKILAIITFFIIISHIVKWDFFVFFLHKIPLLKQVSLERFYVLIPPLWYLLLGVLIYFFYSLPYGKALASAMLISLFFSILNEPNPLKKNLNLLKGFIPTHISYTTFENFFAENLFKKIKEKIGKPLHTYQVASIGIVPEIACYNGFYTIDGYVQNYPLKYKKLFKRIIDNELIKSPLLKRLFDEDGRRCFIFSSDIITSTGKNYYIPASYFEESYSSEKLDFFAKTKITLSIDCAQLKKMSCQYLISALEIKNYEDLGLHLVDVFHDESSIWRLFLYRIYEDK